MKIVLLKSVDNLGQAGEAVEVKRGYFRNFLEPRGMALTATTSNMKMVENRKKKLEALVARELTDAENIKQQLDGKEFTFHLRAGERGQVFGSVTSRDVVEAIRSELNIEIERRRVDMENLKKLGEHPIRIRVYPGVVATIVAKIEKLVAEGEEGLGEAGEDESEKVAFGSAAVYEDDED